MKKKAKKNKNPPLSQTDRFLYGFLWIVVLLSTAGFLYLYLSLLDLFAFSDKNIVAVDNGMSALFIIPFLITFLFSGVTLVDYGRSSRTALLGYGKKATNVHQKDIPIFRKGGFKKLVVNKSKNHMIKSAAKALAVLFSISVLFSGFGFCKRTVLNTNDQIITYNSFNQETSCIHLQDADSITVSIQKTRRRPYVRGGLNSLVRGVADIADIAQKRIYYIQLSIRYGDDSITVTPGDFSNMETEQIFAHLLHIKSYFTSDQCTFYNTDYLDALQEYKNYNEQEQALLLQLFEQ